MQETRDWEAITSSLASHRHAKRLFGSEGTRKARAMQSVLERAETPAGQVSRMGVAAAIKPAADKLAAQHKMEYIMQEETSRAVVKRVEQHLQVTGQLE